ncbi:unnamed protein product [Rhizophagus irregularis]|nr:unnamed protein product [Rhizophagus irregularis]
MGHHIFHEYWLKRCQEMEKKDKDLGINKNLKKRHYGVDCLYRLRQQSTINKYEDLIGIRNNIYYGSDILGYYDSCGSGLFSARKLDGFEGVASDSTHVCLS